MNKLIALLSFAGILAHAQTPVISLNFGPAPSVKVGATATVDIVMTATTAPAGVQFSIAYPSTVTGLTVAASDQATAAGKGVTCNSLSPMTCLVTAINSNTIANGNLVTVSFTSSKAGAVALSLANTQVMTTSQTWSTVTGPLAADVNGNAMAPTAGGTVSVPFVNPFDLNGDGVVDVKDLVLASNQILGISACSTADFNGDGVCNLEDALLLVKAALGQ